MCYANLIYARGTERFLDALASAGGSGLIVPTCRSRRPRRSRPAADRAGIALVPLVAPTTPPERLARIGARARGFVYTVSLTGTTGERAALADTFGEVGRAGPRGHVRARRPGLRDRHPRARRAGGRGGRRRRHRRLAARARGGGGGRRATPCGAGRRPWPTPCVDRLAPQWASSSRSPSASSCGSCLWALGAKGFDAFLITVAIALVATAAKMAAPSLPGNRER
jgi:hypothetical protein